MTLTRGKLLKQYEWSDWQCLEWLQLDQYETQGMFGIPCQGIKDDAILNLVWTYNIKELDGRKKARCACNGSPQAGQVRVLDYTYANCVDQTSSQIFYAIADGETVMVFGADVPNAFGEAPAKRCNHNLHNRFTQKGFPYNILKVLGYKCV